jgi:hypothetical protein
MIPTSLPAIDYIDVPFLDLFSGIEIDYQKDHSLNLLSGYKILAANPQLVDQIMTTMIPALDKYLAAEIKQAEDADPIGKMVHLTHVRRVARILAALGIALAESGKEKETMLIFVAGLKLSAAMERAAFGGPVTLIGGMIGIAINNVICEALQYSVINYCKDAGLLQKMLRAMHSLENQFPPRNFVYHMEHQNMLAVIANLKNDPSMKEIAMAVKENQVAEVLKYYKEAVDPMYDKIKELIETPWYKAESLYQEYRTMEKQLQESAKPGFFSSLFNPSKAIAMTIVAIAVPNFGRAIEQVVKGKTLYQGSKILLLCKRYQLKHLKWPTTLKEVEILKGVPNRNDECSGKPFQIKNDGSRFILYSVGINRLDDGGTNQDELDIVIADTQVQVNK